MAPCFPVMLLEVLYLNNKQAQYLLYKVSESVHNSFIRINT